jgi:pSer/pThr/pTyr-binding forkhead associated (FHA) protein
MESEKTMSDSKEEKDLQENLPEEKGNITDVHTAAQPNLKANLQPDAKTSDARGNKEAEAQKALQTKPTRTEENRPETAILASTRLRRSGKGNISQGTISFGDQRELILVIRGIVERIVLPEDQSIVLGRSDARLRYHADVDLTPYGALDRGVSREHARVYTEEGHLYIVDMNSTNGTFLSGKRLEPNTPALLHKGDELLLGRLPVQILFR